MTPERWARVKDVFQSALDREPELRAAFLAQACAGAPEVLREVESLLASHQEAGSFIETPPFAHKAAQTLEAGTRLGPYEVVGLVGAGGMGQVYRVRDPRLRREVALKVLPRWATRDPGQLRRFEHEARAAGAINHPNILAVFDVGIHGTTPYVVSELLEGETLRERLREGPLAVRKSVECAVQIARAWLPLTRKASCTGT